jgi:hypothetical protein
MLTHAAKAGKNLRDRATLRLQYLKAAKNADFTVAASGTTASVAASASQSLLTPDSLPDLKTRWLLLTNKVIVCKGHDCWRAVKVLFASAKERLAC